MSGLSKTLPSRNKKELHIILAIYLPKLFEAEQAQDRHKYAMLLTALLVELERWHEENS